jgi:hypothetical protein
MKRGKPLRRKTPLKQKTPLKSKTALRRTKPLRSHAPLKSKSTLKQSAIKRKRHYYLDKADRLWQEIQHIIWGHRCARCGTYLIDAEGSYLGSAHHMVKRRILHLRHHNMNGVLGCDDCHIYAPDSWENSAEGFEAWLKENHPDYWGWYQDHRYEDGTKPDWEEECQRLEGVLQELQGKEKDGT